MELRSRGLRVLAPDDAQASAVTQCAPGSLSDPEPPDSVFGLVLVSPRFISESGRSIEELLDPPASWRDVVLPVLVEIDEPPANTIYLSLEEFGVAGVSDLFERRYRAAQANAAVRLRVEDFARLDTSCFEGTVAPYLREDPAAA